MVGRGIISINRDLKDMSRPLTDRDAADLGLTVSDALKSVLETAGDVFIDRPEFIRSDEPRNPLSSAVREVSRYNCRAWARADKSNFSTRVNTGNAELCNTYLEDIGEKPADGGVTQQVPFEGGQCAGVTYIVRRTFLGFGGQADQGGFTNEITGVVGPISALSPTSQTVSCDGSLTRFTLSVTGANGTFSSPIVLGCNGGGGFTYLYFLVRADGQPDNCGDPPGERVIEPPGTPVLPPLDPPDPFNLPGYGDTPVTIDLGDDGNPTIGFPDLGLEIPIQIGGGGDDGGAEGVDDGVPVAPPDPVEGNPEDLPAEDDGGELGEPVPPEAPIGQVYRCIGYDWFIEEFPGGFSRIPGTDRVTPQVIGNLQLKLLIGDEIVKGDNLRLYSSEGVITAPDDSLRVVGVWWSKNPLLPLRLTPIFKLFKENQEEIEEV